MEKIQIKEINKLKNKKSSNLPKKNKITKEKTTSKIAKESKKTMCESKKILKSINININKTQKENISSKKYSMDNKDTTLNANVNKNIITNNITNSTEIILDKKKAIKSDINNKKINLKSKCQKNSEEKNEKNTNNKEIIFNPFLIEIKGNIHKKISLSLNNKDRKNKKKEENKNIKTDNNNNSNNNNINKIGKDNETQNIDKNNNFNTMDFSFDNKLLNTLENKEKKNIYKNRFLNKINKVNNNNSKERNSEGSFGSIIHQKKLKLFSLYNEQNNHYTINIKDSALASISSKNIIRDFKNKQNKEDFTKAPKRKTYVSDRKYNTIEKKISHKKIKNFNNINTKTYKRNNDNKETIKLEAKINKNREIIFNSQRKILIEEEQKEKEEKTSNFNLIFPIMKKNTKNNKEKNNEEINRSNYNNNNKNPKKNNTNNNQNISIKKSITKNSFHKINNNLGCKTLNRQKKNKLCNSNSNLSKKKFQQGVDNKSDLRDKEKTISFKKNLSPTKIDVNLNLYKSNVINNDILSEKYVLLSSERYSSLNKELSNISMLKDNNINNNNIINKNNNNENIISIENLFLKDDIKNNFNKSPKDKKENIDKFLRVKTEISENQKRNKNKNKLNEENINIKKDKHYDLDIKKDKTIKNRKLNKEEIILPQTTLDNETFKKSTTKKLIKNNQYRALLTEMTTINLNNNKNENNIEKEEEPKIKKKYKFIERRRGSLNNEPYRKLTESSENYYDLYKKTFNNDIYNNTLEQKFSFRPKSKNKNFYYKFDYNIKNKDIEDENDKKLNTKGSTISFNTKQKQMFDDINIDELNNSLHKNVLSNSLDEKKKIYNNDHNYNNDNDNDKENEKDSDNEDEHNNNNVNDKENEKDSDNEDEHNNNKNFILDLNHYIPIDENELINTISRPLFPNENNSNTFKNKKQKNLYK